MIRKKIILPAVAIAIIGGATAFGMGTTQAYAQTNSNTFANLVQMIAQKFGLDQSQVQSVVDQFKTQQKTTMQQTMQQREEDRLSKLVQDGKITDAQKKAILDELATLKSKYNPTDLKNLTPQERKQKFQDMQNEIKSWATSQGIDPKYLMPFGGGIRGGHGWHKAPTPTP